MVHPALALERDEARDLALAFANVQKHYPGVRLLSDKHMALFGLGVTATRIYGKRVLIVAGVGQPAPKPPPAPSASVVDFGPVAPHPVKANGTEPNITDQAPWFSASAAPIDHAN